MSIDDTKEMILQFEAGTLPKEEWTHHAHFVMALWYCFHYPLPHAIQLIKEGIKKYNANSGGHNTADSGYHETITVFYTRLIVNYIFQSNASAHLEALLAELDKQSFLVKDFPLQYYSRELLMSREARKKWIAPDKRPLACIS
jgi:hypothetical protein